MITFKSAYDQKRKRVQLKKDLSNPAQQQFKEECDINNILAKYQQTGILEFTNNNQARYGDATSIDFQQAQNIVANATAMFDSLPSSIRAEFENDPALFLDFVDNPENRDKAIEMGLIKEPKPSKGVTPSATASAPPAAAQSVSEPVAPAPKADPEPVG